MRSAVPAHMRADRSISDSAFFMSTGHLHGFPVRPACVSRKDACSLLRESSCGKSLPHQSAQMHK